MIRNADEKRILGILGAGNMGGAIAKGYADFLIRAPGSDEVGVIVYDPDSSKAEALARHGGVKVAGDEAELVSESDIILLAVKPQIFGEVLPRLASGYREEKIVVSIAAGVSISWLLSGLGDGAKVVRAMPNTPAMIGFGITALSRSSSVTDEEFESVKEIFEATGSVVTVPEEKFNAVTGISGSSPAYAYMYMQALIESGIRNGLDEATSRTLAAGSTLGAAQMLIENEDVSAETLRLNVCSPGGTTIEAVKVLEKEGFMDTIKRAVYACVEKSKRMTK